MSVPRHALQWFGALFCAILAFLDAPGVAAQTPRGSMLDQLTQQAATLVEERMTRPVGRVSERRRDRVFVVMRQLPPTPGTILEAVRGGSGTQGDRVVARLEVVLNEAGLTECREKERVGRAHAEAGDLVRRPTGVQRMLLAPCVSLVDVPPAIPEVIGEKLRAALVRSTAANIIEDPDAEKRAEAAYLSNNASEFVSRQTKCDEVLYPVLLQTPGKIVLNLEYYSVERGRAVDIDATSVAMDDVMRAWLRAGRGRLDAPPGYRRLPSQTHPWRVTALGEGPAGDLVVLDADSVRVLRFQFPGLRPRFAAALGPRQRRRREPWCLLLRTQDLQTSGAALDVGAGLLLLTDERRPQLLAWPAGAEMPQLRPGPADLDPALEKMWTALRPQARRQEARWWPAPGQVPAVFVPCFADLDFDGKPDVVWSDAVGALQVKLAAQRSTRTFPGFGDVKAVVSPQAAGAAASFWLTDAVWHGDADRIHQAQLSGDELQVLWSSEPYDGTLCALASLDLNADGLPDLVAAEELADGTRLHAFLAFAGPRGYSPAAAEGAGEKEKDR